MSSPTDRCDVAYKWALPDGLPDAVGMEAGRRRLVVLTCKGSRHV